ncbi:hypothetical protein COCNU_03G006270 [Cocos nucifera]|uniref:Uncharacterized protein n=1 Tax=Cocos nucifera TaxID=13894 RepID=A0A8K0I2I1_COCNU|nr:hypothetical protein COCNU_03G006270 [Cocos nucifera]
MHNFKILELKELLSEQTLFNIGICQVGPQGMDLNLLKKLEKKTHRKRIAEPAGGRITYAKVECLPMPLTSRSEGIESLSIDDFRVVRVQLDLTSAAFDGDRRSQMGRVPSKQSLELSVESRKYKVDAEILKEVKDKAIKEAGKASIRADAIERRAKDIERSCKGKLPTTRCSRSSGSRNKGA